MTVYVDYARNPYGRMKMCHMIADTQEELHAMAETIGLKRRWFQEDASFPHYDVSLSRRALAIQHGALPVSRRFLVYKIKQLRKSTIEKGQT